MADFSSQLHNARHGHYWGINQRGKEGEEFEFAFASPRAIFFFSVRCGCRQLHGWFREGVNEAFGDTEGAVGKNFVATQSCFDFYLHAEKRAEK